MGIYGFFLIAVVLFIVCFLLGKWSRKCERQKKKQKHDRYCKLYKSGKIYDDIGELWSCLRWLASSDERDGRILFSLIWMDMPPHLRYKIERMVQQESAKNEERYDSGDPWQTSAYPMDGGESSE